MALFVANSKEELNQWLNTIDFKKYQETELSSVYFLIEFDNHIEPLYFMPYEDVFFESPCELHILSEQPNLEEYVRDMYEMWYDTALEYEKTMVRDNVHYEIDVPQCTPFLTMPCSIIKIMTESETLDWLLEHTRKE